MQENNVRDAKENVENCRSTAEVSHALSSSLPAIFLREQAIFFLNPITSQTADPDKRRTLPDT